MLSNSKKNIIYLENKFNRNFINKIITMNCEVCEKKVKITAFPCKCKKIYCTLHLDPEKHSCTFDYRGNNKKILREKNPIIVPIKLES